jgi:hypothetical protein
MKRRRFGFLIAGITVTLLAAELTLRVFPVAGIQPSFGGGYVFNCYQKGTFYWIALKPNADCVMKSTHNAFPDVTVTTDGNGMRIPKNAESTPISIQRVLFLGDSFTLGQGVETERTYPELIASLSRNAGSPMRVLNAAIPTADAGYYYLYVTHNAATLRANTIVIGFYVYNDIYDTEAQPQWEPPGALLPSRISSLTSYIGDDGAMYSRDIPFVISNPWTRNFQIALLLTYWHDRLFPTATGVKPRLLSKQLCLYRTSCHDADVEIKKTERLFTAIKSFTDANNMRLVVAIIPAEFQIKDEARFKFNIPIALTPTEKQYPGERWKTFFSHTGIESVDLSPEFMAHQTPYPYFSDDIHWNEFGHQLAAVTIWNILKNPRL